MPNLLRLGGLVFVVLCLETHPVVAEEPRDEWARSGNHPVPENARVTLSADRAEFFLGENVLVHFTMQNSGGPAFNAEFGGDYRGAPRALRFSVSAVNEKGTSVADPYPKSQCMGGLGGPREITTQKPFHHSLPINRYLRIDEPGTYVIRVQHASGWKATKTRPFPVGEIKLTFKRPSPEEAEKLVETWLSERPYSGGTFGEKSRPHADFSQIRAPEYLPALAKAAREGNEQAIVGVGSIATPAATRLLVDLVKRRDGDLQKKLCGELSSRLPDPYLKGELGKRNPFENDAESYRTWLVAHAWDEALVPEVRELAHGFLKEDDTKWVATGAYMLECVGTKADAANIIVALDREVPRTKSLALRTDIFPRPRGACMELQRAARMMHLRGADIPAQPASPGEAMLFLVAIQNAKSFCPEGWVATCAKLLEGDVPYLQEQTLASLPAPLPEELRPRLQKILADGEPDASRAACQVIGRDKLKEFTKPILQMLRTANENWQFRAASNAAVQLEAPYERVIILADRLDDEGMLFECLNELTAIFDNVGGHGSNSNINLAAEAKRVKPLWQAFLAKHAEHLKSGGKFSLPHPEITPAMFPKEFNVRLRNGKPLFPSGSGPG